MRSVLTRVVLALGLCASAHAATTVVPLQANDLAWDAGRGRVWASVPGNGGAHANSVVAIDPVSGALGPSVYVGSEPTKLAISSDGSKLYVALAGAAGIVRVDLASSTLDLDFGLGTDPSFGTLREAADLAVAPGAAGTVGVARGDVAVYDAGTQRAQSAQVGTGIGNLVFGASSTQLFGSDPHSSSFDLQRFAVSAGGVSHTGPIANALLGFEHDLVFDGGWVFGSRGAAVDVATGLRAGIYPNVSLARGVAVDGVAGEVAFIADRVVILFDRASFAPRGTVQIAHMTGEARGFVRAGTRRWAVATSAGQVLLVSAEPAAADGDGDGFADALDNCPSVANASQLNADADGLGDACEVSGPNDPVVLRPLCEAAILSATGVIPGIQTSIANQQALIDTANEEIAYCQAPTDADADGHFDRDDSCSGTPAGSRTDELGCSQAQFCALQSRASCKLADFRNDETKSKKPKDCTIRSNVCAAR